jgi:pimeloyl-ACP methyl ester carboxylesterase
LSKKDKTPFLLKVVRWGFPKLERIAPSVAHRYFIRLFFTPLRYKRPEKEHEFVESAEKFTMRVSQKTIQVYAWGERQNPMIWVMHGWAGRATQFRKFIPALVESGYYVVGFDGPAHGLSEGKQVNILDFDAAFKALAEKVGLPKAAIAHSFGGVAFLYSIVNGLPIDRLIAIASPMIGEEVIKTYLKTIHGSESTGRAFKEWMVRTFNRTFDEFSGLYLAQKLKRPLDLLLVYDEDDDEVKLEHALALRKVYPAAKLLQTKGLGHNRILKEDSVVNRCIEFLKTGH